jgi:hypothetical protein
MMSNHHHDTSFRRAIVVTTWLVLPATSLLVIAACAASEETDVPDAETHVLVPSSDAGGEASIDAEAEADTDAPVVPCAVGGLCTVPTPLTLGSVMAMGGRSKSDVWASGSEGLMMRWDGRQWTRLDSDSRESVSRLFLTSDETWGIAGNLIVRRGIDPTTIRTVRKDFGAFRPFTSIAVLPQGNVYVSVGMLQPTSSREKAPLAKFDFDTGVITNLPDPIHPVTREAQLFSARASYLVPDTALWLVGGRGSVARYPVIPGDAGAPMLGQGVVVPLATDVDLLAAWGQDEHLWAAGWNGTILHYDGVEWHTEDTGTGATIYSIFGFALNDVWAAGDDGTVVHFDGTKWSSMDVGAYRGHLRAVWGAAPDDVWIGGERAMFHWGALP